MEPMRRPAAPSPLAPTTPPILRSAGGAGFFAPRNVAAAHAGAAFLERASGGRPGGAGERRRALFASGTTPVTAAQLDALATRLQAAASAAPQVAPALTPEHRLLNRVTCGASLLDHQRIASLGYQGFLEEQLAFQTLDDSALEAALRDALPSLGLSPAQIWSQYQEDGWTPIFELLIATIYRQIYSPRQLFESLCGFWSDHFNIDVFGDTGWFLKPVDDRTVIRRLAMGSFPQLLQASAKSPAMLAYLTNDSNYADHPNENYARELMELHTMGVDGGYTQEDVREVARCFTGWAYSWDEDSSFGRFRFYPEAHDDGEKWVLGTRIPAGGGITDGEQVLAMLAAHPGTSRFLARKLLRHFWGYDPPNRYVERVALAYRNTGGNLRAMLRIILQRSWMARAPAKLKRPALLFSSTIRALGAELAETWFPIDQLDTMGHLPFSWSPPNGYPDARAYWQGFLLDRWNFAMYAIEEWTGVSFADEWLDPARPPLAIVDAIDLVLTNGTLSETTRARLRGYLLAGRDEHRCREALGLALASPEFQDY